ncbi:MAG TPA: FRG domain-containing protein [Blastocatellia bacterium]|jgi:hypothetical protein|nr:FRG domain-containing protein [Blastocatellia bacterium]
MKDIRVTSWSELNEQLYEGSWNRSLERFRSPFAFRGESNAAYTLKTSLARLAPQPEKMESHLLRNFRKYALRDAVPFDSVWNWLAVAQHHGLPTRLLDWTYSPFVALHFATADLDNFIVDGVIWCVDFVKSNQLLPERLREVLEHEGSNAFTVDMLSRVASNLVEFDALSSDEFVLFIEPPSLDSRIVNQFALFSMMSNAQARLDHWLEAHPALYRRIIVPAELKWEVRDKLDQANITERVLFPGLDGLSSWLRRYYTPKPRREGKPTNVDGDDE